LFYINHLLYFMSAVHPYNKNSEVHNFLFHPLHGGKKAKTSLSILTNIFMTLITGGLWQIPFWIVNRYDHKKIEVWKKGQTPSVNKAASRIFPSREQQSQQPPTVSQQPTAQQQRADPGIKHSGDIGIETTTTERGNPLSQVVGQLVFGKAQWTKYFGDVGVEPPLPYDIANILAGPCPIFSDKTVGDTHILVLIPKVIDGKPLTLNRLGELVKTPREGSGGHPSAYQYICNDVIDSHGDKSAGESHWVLMTRDVISGSKNRSYRDQHAWVADLANRAGASYEIPHVLDAAVCIFMEHAASGKRLYNDQPFVYTRCQEQTRNGNYVVVGSFAPAGLHVTRRHGFDFEHIGVAGLRKF
jgi:hypothetical protein